MVKRARYEFLNSTNSSNFQAPIVIQNLLFHSESQHDDHLGREGGAEKWEKFHFFYHCRYFCMISVRIHTSSYTGGGEISKFGARIVVCKVFKIEFCDLPIE